MVTQSFERASETLERGLNSLKVVDQLAAEGLHRKAADHLARIRSDVMEHAQTIYEAENQLAAWPENRVRLQGREEPITFSNTHRAVLQLVSWYQLEIGRAHSPKDGLVVPTDLLRQFGVNISEFAARLQTERAQLLTAIIPAPVTAPPEPSSMPKSWLTSWRDITAAVGRNYADRDTIKSLNERLAGPIASNGKGRSPMVDRAKLLEWWDQLDRKYQQSDNEQRGRRLSGESNHKYGRDGEVAPEISGSVKKRRSDKKPR